MNASSKDILKAIEIVDGMVGVYVNQASVRQAQLDEAGVFMSVEERKEVVSVIEGSREAASQLRFVRGVLTAASRRRRRPPSTGRE